jgi:hypothetical protein
MLTYFTHTVICSSNNVLIDFVSIAARIFGPKIGRHGANSHINSKNLSPYGGTFPGFTMMRTGSVLAQIDMNASGCIVQRCINKTKPTLSCQKVLWEQVELGPVTSVASSTSAASDLGLVPGGSELASNAAASPCGLVIGVLEAMNRSELHTNSRDLRRIFATKFLNPWFTQYLYTSFTQHLNSIYAVFLHYLCIICALFTQNFAAFFAVFTHFT